MTNDFKVKPYRNPQRKGDLWQVYCGRNTIHLITKTEEEAIENAKILNIDPWYFEKKGWAEFKKART
jgi:hypothetical protein